MINLRVPIIAECPLLPIVIKNNMITYHYVHTQVIVSWLLERFTITCIYLHFINVPLHLILSMHIMDKKPI